MSAPNNGTPASPPEFVPVVIVGPVDLGGFPAGDGVVVRDHASAGFEKFLHARTKLRVEGTFQVQGDHVGIREIGTEQIALNHPRFRFDARFPDSHGRPCRDLGGYLHSHRPGLIILHRRD